MRVDKEPAAEGTKVENDSSDFEDTCDTTPSPSPELILCSSLSSLDGEQTGVDDSDNDSGFVGVSQGSLDRLDTVTLDVNNEINECRSEDKKRNGIYDREATLRELANPSIIPLDYITHYYERLPESSPELKEITAIANAIKDLQNQNADVSAEKWQEHVFEGLRRVFKAVPDSMLQLLPGTQRPGDCARPSNQKPDWLDMDKLRRGQKFAQDYMFPVYFAETLSLFALFSFEDGLKPLIASGRSSTPYTAFKRYLSTGLRIRRWYTEDPWAKGTTAHKDILTVRAMHAAARQRLVASTNEKIDAAAKIENPWCPAREMLLKDFAETCDPPEVGQCPYALHRNSPHRPIGINQADMALTQWGFVGLIISYPKYLGAHNATEEELEAFCHLWRSIGYQLGMEDKYNFCRGTLADIRQRSHDFIEAWVKPNFREITPESEHMMRCVIAGVAAFLPGLTYEIALLYLSEMFNLKMPRLYASMPYKDWIQYNLTKSLFYYTIRLSGIARFFNTALNQALDKAEKFTPEELETIRLKLDNLPGYKHT